MGTVLFFFIVTLWWDANLVLLRQAEFDGETGPAYKAYLVIEQVLNPIIGSGKFVGEAILILGIATGLATIVTNLSFQARALPYFTRKAMGGADEPSDPLKPKVPWTTVALAMSGAGVMIAVFPVALVRVGAIGLSLARTFDGQFSPAAVRLNGVLDRVIDPTINVGLGILFFSIALLLLTIVGWLKEQRRGFGAVVADATDTPRPAVEDSVWPQRMVLPLAAFGFAVILFFFFTMGALRTFNFDSLLTLQASVGADPVLVQNGQRLDAILKPVIGATRFIGLAALMLAIGLALVTIVIQLRATAMLLPMGFAKLLGKLSGDDDDDDVDEEEDEGPIELMSLAPWGLMKLHVLGLVFMVAASVPIVILEAVSIHRYLGQKFAGLGAPGMESGLYKSGLLSFRLYDASFGPWMMFGMGMVLFAIGRSFSTIVGFVQARQMIIGEGTEAVVMLVGGDSDSD